MKMALRKWILPSAGNIGLALLASVLLILSFPNFEIWFLAWFALVPMLFAVLKENHGVTKCFVLGWIFGTTFFFGTCWWLTFAPIHFAGFPAILAYVLFFFVAAAAGIFPAIFAAITAIFIRRFGTRGLLAVPFVWVFSEFLRYWLTGNNWNALAYSQAFHLQIPSTVQFGGIYVLGFEIAAASVLVTFFIEFLRLRRRFEEATSEAGIGFAVILWCIAVAAAPVVAAVVFSKANNLPEPRTASVVAIQPNVPMEGLNDVKWRELQGRHVTLANNAIEKAGNKHVDLVIFPESPMNFMYGDDAQTQVFIDAFATSHHVSVLFNSAEPDKDGKYFNSAVMVGPAGREIGQYDKIHLLPFGEAVPFPLEGILPGFVGNFSYGSEYDLFQIGEAKAGVMICFESHFGELSRQFTREGADVLIEMTNDGYLGPTPVLRQHLANAVFRAVETNRPVLRVTNVGVTAYINEKGGVIDPAPVYQEGTRVWGVSKSDGSQTFYVRFGDWFAWLCSLVTLILLGSVIQIRRKSAAGV